MNKCSKYIEFVNRIIKYYRWKNEEILQNSEMMMYKIIMLLKIDDKFDEAMPNKNKLSHYLKYMDKKLLLKEFVDSINAEY